MRSLFALFAVALLTAALPAKAENIALVLSFENYDEGSDFDDGLDNHDALLAGYRAAGFQAISGRDRSNSQLRRILRSFADELRGADRAVIHITGHVAGYGNQRWILPSDTATDSVTDLEIDGISIEFLTQLLAQKPGQAVLFVGSSDRRFARIDGIAMGNPGEVNVGGVVMISGDHREVSRAVLRDFLNGDSVIEAIEANRRLKFSGDVPFGLTLATDAPAPRTPNAEEIESALRLSRDQRRTIQSDLTVLGYNLGTVDGVFGAATRRALTNWQRAQRIDQTGYLTREQVQRLAVLARNARAEIELDDRAFWARTGESGALRGLRAYLQRYPNGVFAERAQQEIRAAERDSDVEEWERAQRANTIASYERYLELYPRGVYNRRAQASIQDLRDDERDETPDVPEDSEAKRIEDRMRLDNSTRLLIELRLAALGFDVGAPDGRFDDTTRRAIRRYQDDRGLPQTGYVSADMVRMLILGR